MHSVRLTAAAAETHITPPAGAPLLGFLGPSTGVHDELFARVLVLADAATVAVVVTLDLVGMDFPFADEMRSAVRDATGADLVLLASTHTHSAPFTIPWSLKGREWIDGPAGVAWRSEVVARVAEAARAAAASRRPVALRAGRAEVQVGMNRRVTTAEGTAMAPNPDGATVPWVDVLCMDGADGQPVAVLFGHAAHPVIVHGASSLVSADYPGYAVAAVRREVGEGVVPMFAQACGANINGHPLRGGFEAAKAAGELLAKAVLQASAQAQPIAPAPLRTATVTAHLPLQPLPAVADCERLVRECEQRVEAVSETQPDSPGLWEAQDVVLCSRDLLQKAREGGPCTLRFEASALAVGESWGLLSLTHEVFAEYQLWADNASPWEHTMVTAYTNGCETYMPTDRALEEGGYEGAAFPAVGAAMRYPYRMPIARGGEQLVRDAVREAFQGTRPS